MLLLALEKSRYVGSSGRSWQRRRHGGRQQGAGLRGSRNGRCRRSRRHLIQPVVTSLLDGYKKRMFLPRLRDVERFLDHAGVVHGRLKSRTEAMSKVAKCYACCQGLTWSGSNAMQAVRGRATSRFLPNTLSVGQGVLGNGKVAR